MIADPVFFLLAVVAVTLLGLSKGGFFGLGVMALPLMSLSVPPLQAAAIILPTVLAQDALTVWTYRRDWSAWNLKVLLPGSVVGVAAAWLFAAYVPNAYVEIAVGVTGICFSLYTFVNPIIAVALGTLLLGEPFHPRMLVAAGIIIGGILIVGPAKSADLIET